MHTLLHKIARPRRGAGTTLVSAAATVDTGRMCVVSRIQPKILDEQRVLASPPRVKIYRTMKTLLYARNQVQRALHPTSAWVVSYAVRGVRAGAH